MDRDRVNLLVEGEIRRKRAISKISGKDLEKDHLEVAEAMNEVLNAYRRGGLSGPN